MQYKHIILFSFAVLQIACGTSTIPCSNSCERIYSADQCGITRPGQTENELIQRCVSECREAYSKSGDVGTYNPNEQRPRSEPAILENDSQAQLWIDCVQNTACENLEQNYCSPIW